MAHEIESMAWTNQKPWHNLGTEVKPNLSVDQMMKAAKLDWGVSKRPLFFGNEDADMGAERVPGFFALVRDQDNKTLDVVGKDYVPVQNSEAMSFFKEFVEAGDATMETAGSLRGGKMIWGLANLNKSFKLAGDDEVKGYLLVSSPHEQGKAMRIMFTTIRVVCNNTLTAALKKEASGFKMAHRRSFDEFAIEQAKDALGIARGQLDEFGDLAKKLSKKKISDQESLEFLRDVFQPTLEVLDDRKEFNKYLMLSQEALTKAPGALLSSARGTLWGALNAVTYTTDHLIGRGADQRLTKAWFGKTANLKRHALNLAQELV